MLLTPVVVLLLCGLVTTFPRAVAAVALAVTLTTVGLVRIDVDRYRRQADGHLVRGTDFAPLVAMLDRLGIDRAYAHYWIAYCLDVRDERADRGGRSRHRVARGEPTRGGAAGQSPTRRTAARSTTVRCGASPHRLGHSRPGRPASIAGRSSYGAPATDASSWTFPLSGTAAPPAGRRLQAGLQSVTREHETGSPGPAPPPLLSPAAALDDIRAARPVFLQRGWQRAVLRRVASIAALVALDVGGLALGLYLALVVRELVFNGTDILWSLLWEGAEDVAAVPRAGDRARLLAGRAVRAREQRPGPGAVARSLVLVALIVLAFGLGTDYDFGTYGLIPDGDGDLRARRSAGLRAAYESFSRELLRAAGRAARGGAGRGGRGAGAAARDARGREGGDRLRVHGCGLSDGRAGARAARLTRGPL